MNILTIESVNILKSMTIESIMSLAADMFNQDFADSNIKNADIDTLGLFVLAILIPAMNLLSADEFTAFRAYYGIGTNKLCGADIALNLGIPEYDLSQIIDKIHIAVKDFTD